MTQPNLSELAKQGDPSAIATKMNQLLQPRGITATTEVLPGQCLQVVLESAQVLNRQVLATFVQRGLERLGVQAFNSIKLVGRQTGLQEPVWTQNILIAVPPSDQFTPVPNAMAGVNPSTADMTDSASSRPIVPPPPPPYRGGTAPSDTAPAAAALHDFHDDRLSDSSPELTGDYSGAELTSYAPIPGAYRPFALNDDVDDVAADPMMATSASSSSTPIPVSPYSSSNPIEPAIDEYEATQYRANDYGTNEYEDDYDVMPTGTHSLHYPDDLLEEPDEYGDDYDEGFVVSELPPSNRVEPALTLDEYDDYEGVRGVTGTTTVGSSDYFSEGADPEDYSEPYPEPYKDEPDLAALRGSAQPEEEDSPIPWTALIVSLVATWIIGLVGYALWSGANNRLVPQPQVNNSAAPANAPSPTTATSSSALPASPSAQSPAAQSPTAQNPATQPNAAASSSGNPANPALQFTPAGQPTASPASPLPQAAQPTATASPSPTQSPQASPPRNPSPQANATSTASANGIAALAPPAIACRPVPFGANSGPVELSNLGFDTSVTDADGHYVVGCITNHSDQPIAKLTISFQGRSTQNQAVSQNSSTELTFTNLRPRQAVPFRSVYTVNPDINTMTINSISWVPTGSAQPRQVQVNFPLRR